MLFAQTALQEVLWSQPKTAAKGSVTGVRWLCKAANLLQPQTDWNATSHTLKPIRQLLTSRLQRQWLKPTTFSPVSIWCKRFIVPGICKEGSQGQSWVTNMTCMLIHSWCGSKECKQAQQNKHVGENWLCIVLCIWIADMFNLPLITEKANGTYSD